MKRTLILLSALAVTAGAQDTAETRLKALEAQVQGLLQTQKQLRSDLETLRSEYNRLRGIHGVADRIQYPVNDQHDNLTLTGLELVGDAENNRLDQLADALRLQQLQEGNSSGAVPDSTLREAELQVKLDTLDEKAIGFHREAIRTKLESLEYLREGKVLEFARLDRETNFQQFQWFDYELQKGQASATFRETQYRSLHEGFLGGSVPWGTDHAAKQAFDHAHTVVATWQAKRGEQKRQFESADQVWRELKDHPSRD